MTNSEDTGHRPHSRAQPEGSYVLRPLRWRAYLVAVCLAVMVVGYAVGDAFGAQLAGPGTSIVLHSATGILEFITVMLFFWIATQLLAALRHPPRVDAQGLRLWLPATSEQVWVPWEQVIEVHARRGRLYVYVHDPEQFARGVGTNAKKIRRMMRRHGGTAFVSEIRTSPGRRREIDAAIRSFSGGRQALSQ